MTQEEQKIPTSRDTAETKYWNYKHPRINDFLRKEQMSSLSPREKAIHLYYRIRDGWRYDAYKISTAPINYRASSIFERPTGHCIDKSSLLITCLRGIGIPARLELAKIRNHLAVERLIELIGTDELVPHGYVSLNLDGKWIKVSPAFNKELCARYNVPPLEFDGETDSIFQAYNEDGDQFMEYLEYYGSFDDLPLKFIFSKWMEYYPHLKERVLEAGLKS